MQLGEPEFEVLMSLASASDTTQLALHAPLVDRLLTTV
jgi:hypothetical protein